MSIVDEDIRIAGLAASIIRTPSNISTYVMAEITGSEAGRRRLEPALSFDHSFRFMTNSGIVTGDLVSIGTNYFLVMALEPKNIHGILEYYRGTLYKCNSVVTIYGFNSTTQKDDLVIKQNVRCLITQVRAQEWDTDKALALPNRTYRGRTQPFQVYMRASEGLTVKHYFKDQSGRNFRVSKDFDVFISEGILQTEAMWEK